MTLLTTSITLRALAAFPQQLEEHPLLASLDTAALISHLQPEQFARSAEFEAYGPLTLRSLVHYLCSHDQQHLAGLQWLLGKIDAAARLGGGASGGRSNGHEDDPDVGAQP